ncbi:MAG: CvpA family protein [Clostridiales bacterium]|nr:CvpA family protein [Clostridia bacterium]MBQ6563153.1 CvpA family protein [Clostridia bacterium]MCR4884198.1 CvpA family protein [Clostridiales bacterium]
MNIVDYVILGILGVSVLFGIYRGFISSVLNTGGCLISVVASFMLYPRLTEYIASNPELQRTLLTYTDASSRIGDLATSIMNVGNLTAQTIADIVDKTGLPESISEVLRSNLSNQVYGASQSVSSYVSQTVMGASTNILCYIVCFVALYLVISLLLSAIRAIFKLPVLKQLDGLVGGVFGLLRGMILVFVLFALLPLVQTVVPLDTVNEVVSASTLAPLFNNGALVTAIMNGKL